MNFKLLFKTAHFCERFCYFSRQMKQKNIMIIFGVVACMSCSDPAKKNSEANSFVTATNGIELDIRLNKADSLVFVFYKDPFGNDSLRYTRYYTHYATTDSTNISLLLQNLKKPFTKLEKVKNCRSEGKIWCYTNAGIFQTVYFSTRCDACCFIYIIKDGFFFYMKLDGPLANRLISLKTLSKE